MDGIKQEAWLKDAESSLELIQRWKIETMKAKVFLRVARQHGKAYLLDRTWENAFKAIVDLQPHKTAHKAAKAAKRKKIKDKLYDERNPEQYEKLVKVMDAMEKNKESNTISMRDWETYFFKVEFGMRKQGLACCLNVYYAADYSSFITSVFAQLCVVVWHLRNAICGRRPRILVSTCSKGGG